jgi:hypothetical protein
VQFQPAQCRGNSVLTNMFAPAEHVTCMWLLWGHVAVVMIRPERAFVPVSPSCNFRNSRAMASKVSAWAARSLMRLTLGSIPSVICWRISAHYSQAIRNDVWNLLVGRAARIAVSVSMGVRFRQRPYVPLNVPPERRWLSTETVGHCRTHKCGIYRFFLASRLRPWTS